MSQRPPSRAGADGSSSFLRAARAGNLDKVLEYLKGSIDIDTSNVNGLNALHLASKEGHPHIVTELLKRGADVNAATNKGNTALHIASLAGQEEVVKILVQNGANVNVQSLSGFTPLYMAAQENHDSVVRLLLLNGANQSLATEDGFTPLAVALQQGHDKVVAILLENDTKGKVRLPALHIAAKKDDCKAASLLLQSEHNPDVTSKSGFTPLHIAAHYGNENIAVLLLDKGADVNFPAKHHITPLHVASKWGKSNMVTLLLQRKAKIDASTRDGLTPLHCAARSGHEGVVDLLLDRGAPISAKTKNGLAALHMSSQGDHVESARTLLAHKAPVDDVTVDYLTALHVAAHCGHVRVAKMLLDRKADANSRALNGFTPLHIACKKNRIKVVELLLKHGASIEATTESGLTPLHVASFMGCMNIVIFLMQNGASPNVPTVRGETPLHLAARANQVDIVRILLRNGADVNATAREQQTALHIASRMGNVDIVSILLQNGALVDAATKDHYTSLHIAAKEGQEEVAAVLLDNGAKLTSTTKKGFTPLHLAAKYGNIKVARLLLAKEAPVDAPGKNGVTSLHVAAHYDHVNVALLLLEKGASPHATAKNGYTPLHISAKKNQMDIATSLLEYGARANAESKAGFTPLHLAAQEGHTDMAALLMGHQANLDATAKNGLTPLHLCSHEDRVNVASVLVRGRCKMDCRTKGGYTPLHVASHFGHVNMVRFLLQNGADVNAINSHGYTPLHQAAQQGHTLVINLLLEHQASPDVKTNQGQTALSIAQRLGYISVVETLKVVTETIVTTTTTTVTEEKYKVVAPETMHETFMSDSEDEAVEDNITGDQSYRYLTADEMKSLGDDSLPIDVTKDERAAEGFLHHRDMFAPLQSHDEEHRISPAPGSMYSDSAANVQNFVPDNVEITRPPPSKLKWKTFLVSFMVDARGGAMRGCRHSGVRVIIPARRASMPMRITCRYLRREKLIHPPPLMEGEACASRILEMGPAGAKFLGPVVIEVPHFASLRGKEREIVVLRSDNGETWREHAIDSSDQVVQEIIGSSFEGENQDPNALDSEFSSNRITRIVTTDFPNYFAIVTRIRQEVHAVGPEGGIITSTVVPQVQAIFPEGALTKKIKVGLQAHPISTELVTKLLGNRVAVSPIVTVEPRRRKFHKPITLTIPLPQAATRGMINQYNGDAPTLRLLCSITGGQTKAQWEDVTGSTPLTFLNDCVSFTTTVSARFWLMDCRQLNEATKFATEVYKEAIHVPFMAKFVVFAKRMEPMEAQIRVFCMTDDKEEKTLEQQEHFTEVAKSRDVEVLERKPQYVEFAGNLVPVSKSGEQLCLTFQAFHENRLPFTARLRDAHQEPIGRIAFMKEPRKTRSDQTPICNLNLQLPEVLELTADEMQLRHSPYQPYKKDGFDSLRDDIGSRGTSRGASRDGLHYEDRDIMKDPESWGEEVQTAKAVEEVLSPLEEPTSFKGVQKQIPPSRTEQVVELKQEVIKQSHAEPVLSPVTNRAVEDQNMLDLLETEDPEDSSTRAQGRGESVSDPESWGEDVQNTKLVEEPLSPPPVKGIEPRIPSDPYEQVAESKQVESMSSSQTGAVETDRALAVKNMLDFLEAEDQEDSSTRARDRGESVSEAKRNLYVTTEQVPVPAPTFPEETSDYDTQFKVTETVEQTAEGITQSIVQQTTTTFVHEAMEERIDSPNQQQLRRLGSETWQSQEQDTSQVSVSSLPEDERSEGSRVNVPSPIPEPMTHSATTEEITSTQITTHVTTEESVEVSVEHKDQPQKVDDSKKKGKKRNKRQNKNRRKLKDGQSSSKDDSLDQDDDDDSSKISETSKSDPIPIAQSQSVENVISEESSSFTEKPSPQQQLAPEMEETERRKSVEQVAGEVVRNVIEMSLETLSQRGAEGKDEPETNQDLIIQYVSCETETDPWKVSVSTQTFFKDPKKSAHFDDFNDEDFKQELRFHDDSDSCYSSSDSELDDDLLLECESMIISTNLAISTGLMALITGEMALNSEDLALEVGETALETGRIALECTRLRSRIEQEKSCTRIESGMGEPELSDLMSESEVNELQRTHWNKPVQYRRDDDDGNANDSRYNERELTKRTKEGRRLDQKKEGKSLNRDLDEEYKCNQFKSPDTSTQPAFNGSGSERVTLPLSPSSSFNIVQKGSSVASSIPSELSPNVVNTGEDMNNQLEGKSSVSDELRKLSKPGKRVGFEERVSFEERSWSKGDGEEEQEAAVVQDAGKQTQIKSKIARSASNDPTVLAKTQSHKLSPIFQSNEELISQEDQSIITSQAIEASNREESDILFADEEYFKEQLKVSIQKDEQMKNQFGEIVEDQSSLDNEQVEDIKQEQLDEIFGDTEKIVIDIGNDYDDNDEEKIDDHQIYEQLDKMEQEELVLLAPCSKKIESNQNTAEYQKSMAQGEARVAEDDRADLVEAVFEKKEMIVIHDVPPETNVTSSRIESGREVEIGEVYDSGEENEKTVSCGEEEEGTSSGFYDVTQSQNLPPETGNASFTRVNLESSYPTLEYKVVGEEDKKVDVNKEEDIPEKRTDEENESGSSKGPVSPPKVKVNEKKETSFIEPPAEKDERQKSKKEKIEKLEQKMKAVLEKDGASSQPAVESETKSPREETEAVVDVRKNETVQEKVIDIVEEDVPCSLGTDKNRDNDFSGNEQEKKAKPQDEGRKTKRDSVPREEKEDNKMDTKDGKECKELEKKREKDEKPDKAAVAPEPESKGGKEPETKERKGETDVLPMTVDRASNESSPSDKVDDLQHDVDGKSPESQANSSSKNMNKTTKVPCVTTSELIIPPPSLEFKFKGEKKDEDEKKKEDGDQIKTTEEEVIKPKTTKKKSISEKKGKAVLFVTEATTPCPVFNFPVKLDNSGQESADQSNKPGEKKKVIAESKKEPVTTGDDVVTVESTENSKDPSKTVGPSTNEEQRASKKKNDDDKKEGSKKKTDTTKLSKKLNESEPEKEIIGNDDRKTIFTNEIPSSEKKEEEKQEKSTKKEMMLDKKEKESKVTQDHENGSQNETKVPSKSVMKGETRNEAKIETAPESKSMSHVLGNESNIQMTDSPSNEHVSLSNERNCQDEEEEAKEQSLLAQNLRSQDDVSHKDEECLKKQDYSANLDLSATRSRPSQTGLRQLKKSDHIPSSPITRSISPVISNTTRHSPTFSVSSSSSSYRDRSLETRLKYTDIPGTMIRTNDVLQNKLEKSEVRSSSESRIIHPVISSPSVFKSFSTERKPFLTSCSSYTRTSYVPRNVSSSAYTYKVHSRISSPSHFSSDLRRDGRNLFMSTEDSGNGERRSRSLVKSRMRNREEVRDISTRDLLDKIWDRVEERKRKYDVESQTQCSILSPQGVVQRHNFDDRSHETSIRNVNSTRFLNYGSLSCKASGTKPQEERGDGNRNFLRGTSEPKEMMSSTFSSSTETSWKRLHDRVEQIHPHYYDHKKRGTSLPRPPTSSNITNSISIDKSENSIPSSIRQSYSCDQLNKVEQKYKSMMNLCKSASIDLEKREIASKRRALEAEIDDIDYHIFSARLYAEESEDIQETILVGRSIPIPDTLDLIKYSEEENVGRNQKTTPTIPDDQVTSILGPEKPVPGSERVLETSSSSSSPFLLSDPMKLGSGSGSDVQYRTARSSNSRPTSDELDINVLTTSSSNRGSSIFGGSSEYETCATSQDGSTLYVSAVSSQDTSSYATARTSVSSQQSSRGSTLVSDSESSGHLATSETSETLVGDLRDVETPTPQDLEYEEEYEEEPTLYSSSTIVLAVNDPRLQQPLEPDSLSRNDDCEPPSLSEVSATWPSSSVTTAIAGPADTKSVDGIDLDLKTVDVANATPFSPQQPLTSPLSLTGSVGSVDMVSAAGSIISHSSVSSTLSEKTRQLLSYDMSPDAFGTSIEAGDERPVSPTPPTDDNQTSSQVILRSSIGGDVIDFSPCSDDMGMIPPGDLYTHHEVDEEDECSKASNDRPDSVDGIKGVKLQNKNRFSGSFADSASTSSSLQEFERLETEVLKSSSLSGTPKKLTKLTSESRDNESTSSLPDLGDECRKTSAPLTGCEKSSLHPPTTDPQSLLSEIEEGHESQASDSGETVTGPVDGSDESDELKTDNQIDNIIREVTQTSVEEKTLSSFQSHGERENVKEEISGQRVLLSRRGFSTESSDSHARSSISTTNTDSLQARMMELDRDLMDHEDRNTPDTISLEKEEEEEMEGGYGKEEDFHNEGEDQATPVVGEGKPFPESETKELIPQVASSSCMLASTDSLDLGLMTSSFMSTNTMISSSETIELAPPTEPKLLSHPSRLETKNKHQDVPSSDSSSASDHVDIRKNGGN